jgi:hypothetical protein
VERPGGLHGGRRDNAGRPVGLRPLLERFRPRSARSADALILGVLIALATAVYSVYALRIATFQNDEDGYLRLARWIAGHFPGALWQQGIYMHGPQRLDQLIMAIGFALGRGPFAFRLDHVLQCLIFASTALPVFLIARRSGLRRPAAHLAAALAIIVPWAVVTSSFLSESLAYPVFAWVMYLTWLSACAPRTRHEVLAVLLILVAIFTRTALYALAPLLPLAVIWQSWRQELAGLPVSKRLRALPGRLWANHRVILGLLVVGVIAYLLDVLGLLPGSITQKLTGNYGLPHVEPLSTLFDRYRYYLSRVAEGTGFLALAFAAPWVLRELIRPRGERTHGLAVLCLLSLLCVLLSLLQAGPDERYLMYMAIPVALAFAAALQERIGIGALIGAILVVLLIDSVTWPQLANLYDFFTYPAAIFYARVLVNHAGALPLIHPAADRVIEGALLLVVAAWALVGRRPQLALAGSIVVALIALGVGVTQTAYTLRKFSSGAGAGQPAAERSWIDRHVPSGEAVTALAISFGASLGYQGIWREAEFWNTSIEHTLYSGNPGYAPFPLGMTGIGMEVRPGSGLLRTVSEDGHPVPAPHLMLIPRVTSLSLGLEVERVWEDPVLLLNLVRLRQPARAEWKLSETSPEGFMHPGKPATLRVYSDALAKGEDCATMSLVASAQFTGRWRYSISGAQGAPRTGTLATQQAATLTLRLPRESGPAGAMGKLTIRVNGSALAPNGLRESARIENVSLHGCSTAHA